MREKLIDAVAAGTLPAGDEMVKGRLEGIDKRLAQLEAEQHRGRFTDRRWTLTVDERGELKAMAENFDARLAKANPATARELLGMWIQGLHLDPVKREALLVMRRAPVACFATESKADR